MRPPVMVRIWCVHSRTISLTRHRDLRRNHTREELVWQRKSSWESGGYPQIPTQIPSCRYPYFSDFARLMSALPKPAKNLIFPKPPSCLICFSNSAPSSSSENS